MARKDSERPIFRMDAATLSEEENAVNTAHASFLMRENDKEIKTVTNDLALLHKQLQSLLNDKTKGLFGRIREESTIRKAIASNENRLSSLSSANTRLKGIRDANFSRLSMAGKHKALSVARDLGAGNFSSIDTDIRRVSDRDVKNDKNSPKSISILANRIGDGIFGRLGLKSDQGDKLTPKEAFGVAKSNMQHFINDGAKAFKLIPKAMKGGASLAAAAGEFGSLLGMSPYGAAIGKIVELGQQYLSWSRKTHSEINETSNAALLSGVDSRELLNFSGVLASYGGSLSEATQMYSSLASEIGGMQFGQKPGRLLEMAKYLGISLSGGGKYGNPTVKDIMRQLAERFEKSDKMERERMSFMAHRLGIPASFIRAMQSGSGEFERRLNAFGWINSSTMTQSQVQNAVDSQQVWAQVDQVFDAVARKFTDSSFSQLIGNTLTEFGTSLLEDSIWAFAGSLLEIPTKIVGGTIEFLNNNVLAPLTEGIGTLISKIPGLGDIGEKMIAFAKENGNLSFSAMANSMEEYKKAAIENGEDVNAAAASAAEVVYRMFGSGEGVFAAIKRQELEDQQQYLHPQDVQGNSVSVQVDKIVIEEAVDPQNVAEIVPEAVAKRLENYGATSL